MKGNQLKIKGKSIENERKSIELKGNQMKIKGNSNEHERTSIEN